MFDAVTKRWRYVGSVRLIVGPDLARSTVAPHQFLAFVGGKLDQLFIGSEMDVCRRLAELDNRPDADGRFRVNDFLCHADTWQSVVARLLKSTDVVLIDLRNLKNENHGCVTEIKELLNAVSLKRLVFVVDGTTDRNVLNKVVTESWLKLRFNSPNMGLPSSALQLFELGSLRYREIENLLRKLCAAGGAERPPEGPPSQVASGVSA